MRFPQIANNDQALAIAATGELDWFGSFLPDIEKTYVAQDPENHGYWFPAGSMVYFALNFETENEGNKKAFNDINFRHAFSMAMDRQAMVDIAGYGYPTINEYPSGLGRAFHSWNNAEVDAKYGEFSSYNIEGAKKILADAGYKDGDGDGFVETPDGMPISLRHHRAERLDRLGQFRAARRRRAERDRHQRQGRDAGRAGLAAAADRWDYDVGHRLALRGAEPVHALQRGPALAQPGKDPLRSDALQQSGTR